MQNRNNHTLAHTTWNCKYHIVFAPKFRRKVFYGEKRLEIGAILRKLCGWKGINILEAEVCVGYGRSSIARISFVWKKSLCLPHSLPKGRFPKIRWKICYKKSRTNWSGIFLKG